jgi:hypothetical protein
LAQWPNLVIEEPDLVLEEEVAEVGRSRVQKWRPLLALSLWIEKGRVLPECNSGTKPLETRE